MDQGLIKGGSLDNAVVIGDEAILSKEELRYPNEFVRHKILDLMGDLYLIGKYIRGHFIASKSGHPLNVKFARKLKSRLVPINGDIENPGKKPKQTIEVAQEKMELDINDIMSILPHRYPFLLVDRIIKIDGKTKIVGMKNVTFNEQFFNGHFPGHPVMPGVLIVEAMAQVAGVLVLRMEENRNKMPYFMTIDKVRFRKPVFPGSTLIIDVEFVKVKTRTAKIKAKATVDGQIVTEAEMTFIVVNF